MHVAYNAYDPQLNNYPVGVAYMGRAAAAYSKSVGGSQNRPIAFVPLLWGPGQRGFYGNPPWPHNQGTPPPPPPPP